MHTSVNTIPDGVLMPGLEVNEWHAQDAKRFLFYNTLFPV